MTRPGNELLVIVVVERKGGPVLLVENWLPSGGVKKTIGDRVELMMNVGDGLAARFKSFSFFLFPLPRKSSNDFEDKIRERETIGESVGWISIHRASISMEKGKNSTFSNEPFDSFQIFGHS